MTTGDGPAVPARRRAFQGAHVIVHGRNHERGMALVAEIEAQGKGSARLYTADFASFDQVRAFAEAYDGDARARLKKLSEELTRMTPQPT